MVKLFKLQVITQMKLKCMSITQKHLNEAEANGWTNEVAACTKELAQLRKEAMNPMKVLESVQHLCLPSNCGNNLIERTDAQKDKLA